MTATTDPTGTTAPGLPAAAADLRAALHRLRVLLDHPLDDARTAGGWRWSARRAMATLRDALLAESGSLGQWHREEWFHARGGSVHRQHAALLSRLGQLGPHVLEHDDVEQVRDALRRFALDVEHHAQRLHDLAWDEVELELGGSE